MDTFIDLTPEVFKTPEGREKVRKAQEAWESAQANVANSSAAFFREWAGAIRAKFRSEYPEILGEISILEAEIKDMREKQETFLRSFHV
jgi:hypothetical protein